MSLKEGLSEIETLCARYGYPIVKGDPPNIWVPNLLAVLRKLEEWVPPHLRA